MVLSEETVARIELAGKLKQRLVKYFHSKERRFIPLILKNYSKKNGSESEDEKINAYDWFIHCYRFKDGNYFIDRFIKGHQDLSEEEIAILEKWKDCSGGIFEIKAVNEDIACLINLVDGREYHCTSNLGKKNRVMLRPGFFILTRLVPLDDIYLFSGLPAVFPPQARFHVQEMAKDMGQGLIS
ncbi:MAG: hypothetical protein ACOYI2_05320 [Bacillota bacterium]|jgi:hypothetical protein|nr:hypothetical protein [Clostridia bacterium]